MPPLEWVCAVCEKARPEDKINIYRHILTHDIVDTTEEIRYCNDNPDCIEQVKTSTAIEKVASKTSTPIW